MRNPQSNEKQADLEDFHKKKTLAVVDPEIGIDANALLLTLTWGYLERRCSMSATTYAMTAIVATERATSSGSSLST